MVIPSSKESNDFLVYHPFPHTKLREHSGVQIVRCHMTYISRRVLVRTVPPWKFYSTVILSSGALQ